MKLNIKLTAVAAGLALVSASAMAAGPGKGSTPYEVWGADQSNSIPGANRGTQGSYMWIWNGEDVAKQVKDGMPAQSIGCDGSNTPGEGPCDMNAVFTSDLEEHDGSALTGETLGSLPLFGRLHGMIADPQNMYMNVNSFVPGGGYVGIMDGDTKEAVALFRVTQIAGLSGTGRSLHMSFWNSDGSALLLANLHGRILERIDITRDVNGKITGANFNRAAGLNVGPPAVVADEATAFVGTNAQGNALVSTVSGSYAEADMGTKTPSGADRQGPGRGGNVIVCPIVSDSDKVYITFGGGGLLIADSTSDPMNIIGEYTNDVINGAGCGGIQIDDQVYLNAGASASAAGQTQSMMKVYAIDDTQVGGANIGTANVPAPIEVYSDTATNTNSGGNTDGTDGPNTTGQLPGVTTRRDAHGMARTLDGAYIHQADRLQNNIEVIDTASMSRIGSYDLTSANGQGGGVGPCAAASVSDDAGLPGNDPAPDLMGTTPDGKYLVVATRGPSPVSVGGNAQGSCPGVGVIGLRKGGSSGKLLTVLRTTNTVDDSSVNAPNGHAYTGAERSDIHGASVRKRVEDMK